MTLRAFFRHYYYIAALFDAGCLLVDSTLCYMVVFFHYRGLVGSTTGPTFTSVLIHPLFLPPPPPLISRPEQNMSILFILPKIHLLRVQGENFENKRSA